MSLLKYLTFRNISVGIVVLLAQLFMFININMFFKGAEFEQFRMVTMIYLVMYSTFFAIPDFRSQLFSVSIWSWLSKALISFGVTIMLLSVGGGILVNSQYFNVFTTLGNVGIGLIIFHSIIVAIIEETIFRGVLYNVLDKGKGLGIFSNILFALFHWSVYGGNIIRLFILFVIGCAFCYANSRFGARSQNISAGMHSAYNVFIVGLKNTVSFG